MPTMCARRRGRPPAGAEATLDDKARAAKWLLWDEVSMEQLQRLTRRHHKTLYRWVREVCTSDHELADTLRALAEKRGLL